MSHSWQDVALAFIAIIPATVAAIVAAISSLRNGREQTRVKEELKRQGAVRRIGRN